MGNPKYNTSESIIEAVEAGELTKRSVYNMIQYYKNTDPQRAEMYRSALSVIKTKKGQVDSQSQIEDNLSYTKGQSVRYIEDNLS